MQPLSFNDLKTLSNITDWSTFGIILNSELRFSKIGFSSSKEMIMASVALMIAFT